jgi:hypothetical protein
MATDNSFKAKFKMSPPSFGGSYKEDVKDWTEKFERAARVNHWLKDDEKARFLPCFLTGSANIWYENLEHSGGTDLTTLLKTKYMKFFFFYGRTYVLYTNYGNTSFGLCIYDCLKSCIFKGNPALLAGFST